MTLSKPIDLYREKIKAGRLQVDPAQDKAIMALDRLFDDIMSVSGHKAGWMQRLLNPLSRISSLRGVYIYGAVGRGKSMLMDNFYEALPDTVKKRRVHFHAFMIEVHDFIHALRGGDGGREAMDAAIPMFAAHIATRSRILCFDEFHITDVVDAMILGRLFSALFDQGVVVVATSNWPPDDLYKGGLQRDRFLPFIALLKQCMEIVYLNSPTDYRARKLREMPVYFHPLTASNTQKADAVFVGLTDGAMAGADLIIVKGRTIDVPSAVNGVARFAFSQLCERPLGAEDYLSIAKRYHTVFLENIPRMGYDRRNEAKRLMTLIDVLYDQKRNVVITADESPEKLYTGHDHAFEFQRTVSRLLEMQSPEYLNKSG